MVKFKQLSFQFDEVADSVHLVKIWDRLRHKYFPNIRILGEYQITWSSRCSKRNLASCNYKNRKILVSPALNNVKFERMLSPLIYHEMCHAVLGEPKCKNGRFVYHGVDFHTLEAMHPLTEELNAWIKNGGWANAKRNYTRAKNKLRTKRKR